MFSPSLNGLISFIKCFQKYDFSYNPRVLRVIRIEFRKKKTYNGTLFAMANSPSFVILKENKNVHTRSNLQIE